MVKMTVMMDLMNRVVELLHQAQSAQLANTNAAAVNAFQNRSNVTHMSTVLTDQMKLVAPNRPLLNHHHQVFTCDRVKHSTSRAVPLVFQHLWYCGV